MSRAYRPNGPYCEGYDVLCFRWEEYQLTLRLGILGAARIAKSAVVDPLKEIEGMEVSAIASRSADVAERFANQLHIPTRFSDYSELLADNTIDAVYIPLPNSLHAEWTIRALSAGKAVLCEKPLASNSHQAELLNRAASESGMLLMEAFHYRYHPLAAFIEETIQSGCLGEVRSIRAVFCIPRKFLAKEDIRFNFALSGGALMDVGAYCVNIVRFVMGAEPLVTSASPTLVSPEVDGAMIASLSFPNEATATIECSLIADHWKAEIEVSGTEGHMYVKNPFLPQLGNQVGVIRNGVLSTRTFECGTTYLHQACAFKAAMSGSREKIITGPDDSVSNMAVIDSIYRAAKLIPRGTHSIEEEYR